MSIQAIGWQGPDGHGRIGGGDAWCRPGPLTWDDADAVTAFCGRPLKYVSRLTDEARAAIVACRLALPAAAVPASREVALLAAGDDASLAADLGYFADYVAHGRSLGRGNLFVHTLPSSTLGQVAIALGLAGPAWHLQDARQPVHALLAEAELLLAHGDAECALAIWSDAAAAVCLACRPGPTPTDWPPDPRVLAAPAGAAARLLAAAVADSARRCDGTP